MNILSRVTLKTLLKNKTRTIVTIIGIILSAAMITAVTTSIASLQQYLLECSIYKDGNWHGSFQDMPFSDMARLTKSAEVESAAFAQELGYAQADSSNDDKPYFYVLGGDELFFERLPVHLTEGRLPESSTEILLPEHYFSYGGERPELGSTLTLDLGDRYWEGERLGQYTSYWAEYETSAAEELIYRESRDYTVVGFYERPSFEDYSAPGYTLLTCWDPVSTTEYVESYFLMEHPKKTFDFMAGFSDEYGGTTNTDLLMFSGAARYGSYYTVLYGMGAILIALIMFGSISLIYNAFSISVSERTKQFGLLSSVGATKRQIRRMVFAEAVYVSAVGIPLGILSGIAGMTVTFHFIGDKLSSVIGYSEVSLKMSATLPAIIIACAVAFVTVLISAWVPSRRATKVTAIEAIHQSADVSIKPREVKTSKLTYKLFGLEGAIAGKHFKRSRRRYRATVVSLFMSVVLFISASSFCTYMTDAVSGVFEHYDYDIKYSWGGSLKASDGHEITVSEAAECLSAAEGVTRTSYMAYTSPLITLEYGQLTDEALQLVETAYDTQDGEPVTYTTRLYICGVEDENFREYLQEQRLDKDSFFDSENPQAVVMSELSMFNYATERMEKTTFIRDDVTELTAEVQNPARFEAYYNREDLDKLTDEEREAAYSACWDERSLSIGAQVTEMPFGLNRSECYDIYALYPMSIFQQLYGGYELSSVVYFKTDGHKAAMTALMETAETGGLPSAPLYDVYEMSETEMNLVLIMKVFAYGFITLISLISLANVFNTISTNIHLRRREFAMLKSVGMTSKGFNKMMNFECLLYGTKSLMYGIPAAFCLTYLMFRSVRSGYDTGFYLPWGAVAIAVGSVFIVVFATMMYSMRRIKKENPIDALKSETT
ncbi:MAG: ABC transporter permease [Oscillospiraceae bacterium]